MYVRMYLLLSGAGVGRMVCGVVWVVVCELGCCAWFVWGVK